MPVLMHPKADLRLTPTTYVVFDSLTSQVFQRSIMKLIEIQLKLINTVKIM